MAAYSSFLGLVVCCFAAAAAAAPNKAQQNCLSGVPCGNLCAPLGGTCIASQCYDSLGYPALCYAPMANTYDSSSWWQPLFAPIGPMFPSFRPSFQPYMPPMQPMAPMGDMFAEFGSCGGNGPCNSGEFCDVTGVCREDTCQNQFTFGCPKDTGNLIKVNCIHNMGYNKCYESSSGGFKCYKGPAGGTVACASNGFSTTSASMTANFNINDNKNNNLGDKQQQQQQGGTAGATSSSTGSGSGTTSVSGTVGVSTTTTAQNPEGQHPGVQNPNTTAVNSDIKTTKPNAAANSTAAAIAATTAAVASTTQQQQQARRQRRHKAKVPVAAAAATTKASGTPAKATFIKNGVPTTQKVTVNPNTQTVTVTDVTKDGSAAAVGSATGDQKIVATNVIPGGSSVTSAASSGSNKGSAAANSAAAASATGR